jgi:hypothetical protein
MNKIYNAQYVENILKIVNMPVCVECIFIGLCREIYFENLRDKIKKRINI